MIKVQIFPFNAFQVNTYVLYDETGECVIVDAACYSKQEEDTLRDFIDENKLKPVVLLNTHAHIDHLLGNNFVKQTWNLKPQLHRDGIPFLETAVDYGASFGFDVDEPVMPDTFLEEGHLVRFGEQELKVFETPGHAAGSVCFYHEKERFVVAGDVLFQNSIGRTDLPTGNFETLEKSIKTKLFILPDDVKVYCGHGPETTIGWEKNNNPFLS